MCVYICIYVFFPLFLLLFDNVVVIIRVCTHLVPTHSGLVSMLQICLLCVFTYFFVQFLGHAQQCSRLAYSSLYVQRLLLVVLAGHMQWGI